MHIHYDHKIDLDEVVDTFSKLHPRKLHLSTLLQDHAAINVYTGVLLHDIRTYSYFYNVHVFKFV